MAASSPVGERSQVCTRAGTRITGTSSVQARRAPAGEGTRNGGADQQRERGQAVAKHDGKRDPQDPARRAVLPVRNRAGRPALATRIRPQRRIACRTRPSCHANGICTGPCRLAAVGTSVSVQVSGSGADVDVTLARALAHMHCCHQHAIELRRHQRLEGGGDGVEGQRTEQRACQHGQRRLRPHDHALHSPMRPIRAHTLQGSDVRQR